MAAEIVGTAYVRIRAITAGLAKDISDGVDKGVKDADVDKAGKALGGDLGEASSKEFGGSMADGVGDALDSPELHKAAEKGGGGVAKDVSKGIDDENKRRNPFTSLLDALDRLDVDKPTRDKFSHLGDTLRDSFDDADLNFDFDLPDLDRKGEEAGRRVSQATKKGFDDEHKKNSPFDKFAASLKKIDLPKPIEWAAIFGPTTLAPIIGTITSLIGLVVQALGFVVLAAAGAAVALAGIAAVALPGLGALFAAFKVETKQLEKFKETAKKLLAPWKQIGVQTQKFLLPGITALLESMGEFLTFFIDGTKHAESFATTVGRTFGNFARVLGDILTTAKNFDAFGTILGESSKFLSNMALAALALVDNLLPFLAAAAPLATQFSESVTKWALGLNESMTAMGQEGMTAKFQGWYDKLALLVGIVGDVFVGLWNILSIAGETATPFFDKLGEAVGRFREWTSSVEGKNTIKAFFDNIQPVLDQLWRLLGNVIDLIVKPAAGDGGAKMFENLAGALDMLNDVLENPVTAQVVPYLLGLATALTALNLVGLSPGKLFSLGEGLGKFTLALRGTEGLSGTAAKLGAALAPLAGALFILAAAIAAVALVWIFWDEVNATLSSAWEWFTKLKLPMQILVGTLLILAFLFSEVIATLVLLAAVAYGVVWAIKNWDKVVEAFNNAKDAVFGFFQNLFDLEKLPGRLAKVGEAIVGFITDLPEKLAGVASTLIEAIIPSVERITAALAPIGEAIVGFITSIPEKLAGLGEAIGSFFEGIPTTIKEGLLAAVENIPSMILTALGAYFDVGQNLLGLLADGLKAALPRLIEFVVSVPGLIIRAIQAVLPTMLSLGLKIIGFILDGLSQNLPKILFFFLRLPFEIGTILRKALIQLAKLGGSLIASLATGIFEERGRIFDFFKNLPKNLLSMVLTGLKFLLDIGTKIAGALYNGLVNNVGAVFDWFKALPGVIIGLLGQVIGILFNVGGNLITGLLNGVKALFGSVDEYFMGIPQHLVDLIVSVWSVIFDLGGQLPGLFLDGIIAAAQILWDFFLTLPATIVETITTVGGAITDLGGLILGWIVEGLEAAWHFVADWVTRIPGLLIEAFNGILGAITDIGGTLLGWIVDGLEAAWHFVLDYITEFPGNLLEGFQNILGAITDIGGTLIGWIVDGLEAAVGFGGDLFNWVRDLPGNLLELLEGFSQDIIDLGGSIAGWIVDGIAGLGQLLVDALKTAWNFLVDKIPKIDFKKSIFGQEIGFEFDLGANLRWNADGGVFKAPTVIGIGEAGAEAVVPMTRPSRALAVMNSAGLDRLVLDAFLSSDAATQRSPTGDTTMLHIENAVMTSPVDVDMVAQRVTAAYNRLAS